MEINKKVKTQALTSSSASVAAVVAAVSSVTLDAEKKENLQSKSTKTQSQGNYYYPQVPFSLRKCHHAVFHLFIFLSVPSYRMLYTFVIYMKMNWKFVKHNVTTNKTHRKKCVFFSSVVFFSPYTFIIQYPISLFVSFI